ncbi:Ig-like domain-containing protein, partial [bacterium]|nr:Ig-like domain-containing protein [bacterium]
MLLLAGACAKMAPPPGGPEDLEAPTILVDLGRPAPGSAGFGAADTVRIVFSERPDRRSVMRALRILPNVDFRDVSWEEDTLSLVPDPAWAEGRGTLIRISRGARDRRGNPLPAAFQLPFTTKAVADSGVISGRVWVGRERDDRSPVLLFAFDAADSMDAAVAAPYAVAEAGAEGRYRLAGLDTARTFRVLALLDRN